jgi:hypothetical protein
VEAAVARGVAAVEPGRVSRWNNHDGFYINEGAIWRFRALLEEGDTQLSPTGDVPMGFSPEGGYWHYDDAAIGDHWLQATPEKGRPALDFVAPQAGTYHFEVDMAARFMGGPPICLSATAKDQRLWEHELSRPSPTTERFDISLNAGEAVTFIASNPPGAGMQRAVCFVKVDLA